LQRDPKSSVQFYRDCSFFEEFDFLQKDEISRVVEYGAELWMNIKKIHKTASNRA